VEAVGFSPAQLEANAQATHFRGDLFVQQVSRDSSATSKPWVLAFAGILSAQRPYQFC